jgi:hypothetical protein
MNKLTQFLVESILNEAEIGITVLLPGGFKPPHGGHLELAKRYASTPNVSQVKILVGPKERDGITRDQSLAVWKELLAGTSNIVVESVTEDNPLVAAYKYIETAKPGNYALASSSKGSDYTRVQAFTKQHAEDGKYYRAGVNVVELPLDTKPMLYSNRTDNLNGTGISASILRKDLAAGDYNNFKTNYPDQSESTLKRIFDLLVKKKNQNIMERQFISEGGAAGHLAHPYEDMELTFGDVENMIDLALSGKIEYAQEKLDGQNLMVTYKDGEVRAARNKGHIKDGGANSLTVSQVENMFSGRGPIQSAFAEAMKDLKTAIDRLTPQQKQRFFANGTKFVNLEVLYPATANVIPYGATQLRLHNITAYDQSGNVVDQDQEAARQLQGAIRQVEAENQKTYQIKITDPVTINKSKDYKNQRDQLTAVLNDLRMKNKLSKDDKMSMYFQAWWKNFITNTAKQYGYKIPTNTLQQLINRWAFDMKDVNIKAIRDSVTNEDFKNWMTEFEKNDLKNQKKIAAKPIENLFLKLGVYTLQNVKNLVAMNPNDSVNQIKDELNTAIDQIKATATSQNPDKNALSFLSRELSRLNDIGGFKAIVPSEGIVFKYNNKLYKLTGAFAPINQILGYLKF